MQERDNRRLRDDEHRRRDTACGATTTPPGVWSDHAPAPALALPDFRARFVRSHLFDVGAMIPRGLTGWRLTAIAAAAAISVGAMAVRARRWLPGVGIETCESWQDDNCAGINAWPSLGNAAAAPTAALAERHVQPTGGSPELPRSVVDTRLPALSGRVLRAPRPGDLQRALDGARLGDQIVLSPGVTYSGNF